MTGDDIKPPTMDVTVARVLFPALGAVAQGKCGFFRLTASNPNGVQGVVVAALDEIVWRDFVLWALTDAKIPTVEVGRG